MMKRIYFEYILILMVAAGMALTLGGCKKFASVPEVIEQYHPDTILPQTLTKRRVLLIGVDGLRGDVLGAAVPTNLNAILANAKYNFKNAPASYFPIDNTSSWASMLTGNSITRVWDSTFYALPDSNNAAQIPLNLTAPRYIHLKWPKARVAAIGSWPKLVTNLLAEADVKIVTTNDTETKTAAANSLKTDSALLTIVQLGGVVKAGLQGGFTAANANYTAAIQQADADIAEIMNAVKSRSSYAGEKWLVLIAPTQVSDALMQFATAPAYIPEFVIAYNPLFKKQNLFDLKPPLYSKREDIAANILYWLQVSHNGGIVNGISWLNSYELEFNN